MTLIILSVFISFKHGRKTYFKKNILHKIDILTMYVQYVDGNLKKEKKSATFILWWKSTLRQTVKLSLPATLLLVLKGTKGYKIKQSILSNLYKVYDLFKKSPW